MKLLFVALIIFKNSGICRCFQEIALNFLLHSITMFKIDTVKHVKYKI
jgi:hypothetical protein